MMSYLNTAARLIAARYSEARKAVYAANEPEGEALARSYKWWRQHGRSPAQSVERAALDYFRRDRRWPKSPRHDAAAQPFGPSALRWCEDPAAIGLRFVGFADKVAPRSVDHRGWFTDSEFQSDVLRGAVYQLPGRKGLARYVAGYREGSEGKHAWSDMAGDGAAAIAFGEVFSGTPGDDDGYYFSRGGDAPEGAREAARRADQVAERYAEYEREYQDAARAASRWQELASDMESSRAEARTLVRDMRAARNSGIAAAASICAALHRQVRALLSEWEAARQARENIADEFAFWRDGRSLSVAEFAAAEL